MNEESDSPRPSAFPTVQGAGDIASDQSSTRADLFTAPESAHVPGQTPAGAASPTQRGSPLRWVVAAVATVLVVGLVAGAFFLAGPRVGTPSVVAHFAPANTAEYVELRLDLPGDQHDRLASFLSHFPGFADQASLQQKLDDTLNQALKSSNSGLDWQTDVEPWFGGQVAFFGTGPGPSFTAALSVKDRTRLDQLVADKTAQNGATQQNYQGQVIWTVLASDAHRAISAAVTNDALVVGDSAASVEAALDAQAGRAASLASDTVYTQQLVALDADRLATFYFDSSRMTQQMQDAMGSFMPSGGGMVGLPITANVKIVGEVRAESDHLALVTRTQLSGNDLPPLPANRHTSIAERMPSNSMFYLEIRDVGSDLKFVLNKVLAALPSASPGLPGLPGGPGAPFNPNSLSQFLGTDPQSFLDFVQDVGVSVTYDTAASQTSGTGGIGVGLVATVDDENVARTRVERILTTLRALATFGGGSNDITVSDQPHGGATITVITIAGSPGPTGQPGPPVSLGVTVANGQLLIGLGDFVANALDRQPADSLASNPTFKAALDQGGIDNAGFMWADVAGARSAFEARPASPATVDHYNQEIKPFVDPLNDFLFVNTTDGSTVVGHGFLFVK